MIKGQISIFDKKLVTLIEDCTSIHPLLKKNSVYEVFMEQTEHYIILIDNVYYGIFKKDFKE